MIARKTQAGGGNIYFFIITFRYVRLFLTSLSLCFPSFPPPHSSGDLPEFQQVYFEDKRDFAGCIRSFLDVWIGQTRPHIVRGLDKEMVSYIKDHYHHGHPVWDALFVSKK